MKKRFVRTAAKDRKDLRTVCGYCGKVGYSGRKAARKMLRVLHPDQVGVDMHIYECQAGGAPLWHIGNTPQRRREQMRRQPPLLPLPNPPLHKMCEVCGTPMPRRRGPSGALEGAARYRARRACSQECRDKLAGRERERQ